VSFDPFFPVAKHTYKFDYADFPPHYKSGPNGPVLSTQPAKLPQLGEDGLAASGRDRIPPPQKPFNFLPDLMAETEKGFKPRDDIKPLHVVQPEGVSFKMNGHELEWQNWKMHICEFNIYSNDVLTLILLPFSFQPQGGHRTLDHHI
jgi:primary-amine oxidase